MTRIITITLNDEAVKALEWDIAEELELWANIVLNNRIKWCYDKLCEEALADTTDTILTVEDKQAIATMLNNQGITIIRSVKALPENVKEEIVKRANIKSAVERNAESNL